MPARIVLTEFVSLDGDGRTGRRGRVLIVAKNDSATALCSYVKADAGGRRGGRR